MTMRHHLLIKESYSKEIITENEECIAFKVFHCGISHIEGLKMLKVLIDDMSRIDPLFEKTSSSFKIWFSLKMYYSLYDGSHIVLKNQGDEVFWRCFFVKLHFSLEKSTLNYYFVKLEEYYFWSWVDDLFNVDDQVFLNELELSTCQTQNITTFFFKQKESKRFQRLNNNH